MSGFDRRRDLRMGLAWSQLIRKGLVATSLLKRATLIWFSPPATSPNRVAPSFLKVDRHLISAGLREDQVGPREYGERMPAKWMIPRMSP